MDPEDELNLMLGIGPSRPKLPVTLERAQYKSMRKLGSGSYGEVVLVFHTTKQQYFVVKHIKTTGMNRDEKRFIHNEIAVLQRLHHPNIIAYTEHFEEKGNVFIVMEYADVGDLYGLIRKQRRLKSERVRASVKRERLLGLASASSQRKDGGEVAGSTTSGPSSRRESSANNSLYRSVSGESACSTPPTPSTSPRGPHEVKSVPSYSVLFSEVTVIHLLIQMGLALKHLHERRLLHRDIKSKNVFLMRTVAPTRQSRMMEMMPQHAVASGLGIPKSLRSPRTEQSPPATSARHGNATTSNPPSPRSPPFGGGGDADKVGAYVGVEPGVSYLVKLGDFGISTVLRSTNTKTVCGTPNYFSPELCAGIPYDEKSDMWSLGVVLYEMCCGGEMPFKATPSVQRQIERERAGGADGLGLKPPGGGLAKGGGRPPARDWSGGLLRAIMEDEPLRIPIVYSDDLWRVISKLLHKDPKQRPTAASLLMDPLLMSHVPGLIRTLSTCKTAVPPLPSGPTPPEMTSRPGKRREDGKGCLMGVARYSQSSCSLEGIGGGGPSGTSTTNDDPKEETAGLLSSYLQVPSDGRSLPTLPPRAGETEKEQLEKERIQKRKYYITKDGVFLRELTEDEQLMAARSGELSEQPTRLPICISVVETPMYAELQKEAAKAGHDVQLLVKPTPPNRSAALPVLRLITRRRSSNHPSVPQQGADKIAGTPVSTGGGGAPPAVGLPLLPVSTEGLRGLPLGEGSPQCPEAVLPEVEGVDPLSSSSASPSVHPSGVPDVAKSPEEDGSGSGQSKESSDRPCPAEAALLFGSTQGYVAEVVEELGNTLREFKAQQSKEENADGNPAVVEPYSLPRTPRDKRSESPHSPRFSPCLSLEDPNKENRVGAYVGYYGPPKDRESEFVDASPVTTPEAAPLTPTPPAKPSAAKAKAGPLTNPPALLPPPSACQRGPEMVTTSMSVSLEIDAVDGVFASRVGAARRASAASTGRPSGGRSRSPASSRGGDAAATSPSPPPPTTTTTMQHANEEPLSCSTASPVAGAHSSPQHPTPAASSSEGEKKERHTGGTPALLLRSAADSQNTTEEQKAMAPPRRASSSFPNPSPTEVRTPQVHPPQDPAGLSGISAGDPRDPSPSPENAAASRTSPRALPLASSSSTRQHPKATPSPPNPTHSNSRAPSASPLRSSASARKADDDFLRVRRRESAMSYDILTSQEHPRPVDGQLSARSSPALSRRESPGRSPSSTPQPCITPAGELGALELEVADWPTHTPADESAEGSPKAPSFLLQDPLLETESPKLLRKSSRRGRVGRSGSLVLEKDSVKLMNVTHDPDVLTAMGSGTARGAEAVATNGAFVGAGGLHRNRNRRFNAPSNAGAQRVTESPRGSDASSSFRARVPPLAEKTGNAGAVMAGSVGGVRHVGEGTDPEDLCLMGECLCGQLVFRGLLSCIYGAVVCSCKVCRKLNYNVQGQQGSGGTRKRSVLQETAESAAGRSLKDRIEEETSPLRTRGGDRGNSTSAKTSRSTSLSSVLMVSLSGATEEEGSEEEEEGAGAVGGAHNVTGLEWVHLPLNDSITDVLLISTKTRTKPLPPRPLSKHPTSLERKKQEVLYDSPSRQRGPMPVMGGGMRFFSPPGTNTNVYFCAICGMLFGAIHELVEGVLINRRVLSRKSSRVLDHFAE